VDEETMTVRSGVRCLMVSWCRFFNTPSLLVSTVLC
jgi:hypothetical protein